MKVTRERDKSYCYKINPHLSNINHHLSIVNFYIEQKQPKHFIIEPDFKTYKPDVFFQNLAGNTFCVEIQLTPISNKKMQQKINSFMNTYGTEHNAKTIIICSDYHYKNLKGKEGFKIIQRNVPIEILINV